MDPILVTGADGFIGSHLVESLVRAGNRVRAFVLYNAFGTRGWLDRFDPEILNHVEVHIGDIRDSRSAAEAVQGCSTVYHLAALIGIPYSYRAPETYVDTNVRGTLNLLQSSVNHGTARFIHVSTSEVYGTAQFVPITEEHPLNAQSPYAATKIAADQLALSYFRSFQLPVTVVRPFNTYGPRQSARAIIPTVISQIAAGRRCLRLGSLHPMRDFNYVSDTVRGMMAAAGTDQTVGETVNLCAGFEISIGELTALIAELMKAQVDISEDPERIRPAASEVDRLQGDGSKIRRLTGWHAEYDGKDGLRLGLEKTIDWFTRPENAAGYRADRYQT